MTGSILEEYVEARKVALESELRQQHTVGVVVQEGVSEPLGAGREPGKL